MNRLEILVLDRTNGIICNQYIDVETMIRFFHRSGNVHRYHVVARKGRKALYIDKIDPLTIVKDLNDFNAQTQ